MTSGHFIAEEPDLHAKMPRQNGAGFARYWRYACMMVAEVQLPDRPAVPQQGCKKGLLDDDFVSAQQAKDSAGLFVQQIKIEVVI